jgi:hypothetical protein
MSKVIKTLFEDAVVKPKGEGGSGDCFYANGDSGLPLVIGEKLGEETAALDYIKKLGG